MLIDNREHVADRRKIKGQLPLEHTLGFSEKIKKITKNLGFYLNSTC